jgi:hypothetical protein
LFDGPFHNRMLPHGLALRQEFPRDTCPPSKFVVTPLNTEPRANGAQHFDFSGSGPGIQQESRDSDAVRPVRRNFEGNDLASRTARLSKTVVLSTIALVHHWPP